MNSISTLLAILTAGAVFASDFDECRPSGPNCDRKYSQYSTCRHTYMPGCPLPLTQDCYAPCRVYHECSTTCHTRDDGHMACDANFTSACAHDGLLDADCDLACLPINTTQAEGEQILSYPNTNNYYLSAVFAGYNECRPSLGSDPTCLIPLVFGMGGYSTCISGYIPGCPLPLTQDCDAPCRVYHECSTTCRTSDDGHMACDANFTRACALGGPLDADCDLACLPNATQAEGEQILSYPNTNNYYPQPTAGTWAIDWTYVGCVLLIALLVVNISCLTFANCKSKSSIAKYSKVISVDTSDEEAAMQLK